MKKELFLAIAVLMSTIIGAGIFGLPYAGAQSGFLIAVIFLFALTGVIVLLHLFYGKVISCTREEFQLTGYIGRYLGDGARKFIGLFVVIGFYGSLLVYMIIGGDFLHIALSPFINLPPIFFSLIMFVIGSVAIYFGLKLISGWDFIINIILVLAIILLFIWGLGLIQIDNLKTINLSKMITPYGAIFYSLIGIAALPEIKRIFSGNHEKQYKKAIIIGTIIPAIIYLIFMLIVIGLNGSKTPQEAILGLTNHLGREIILIGSIFGFLMVLASFFSLGLALKQTYIYDFKVNKNIAWILTCSVPPILLLLGMRNFIIIIGIMGAMIGATEGTAIVLMYRKVVGNSHKIARFVGGFMIVLLVFGFICTIINIL
ncbi:MAG: aromatic amino acid transport family protein [Nanoarchaeota archaeon]|nr:aromatic amino acid transport family protein [Nanoarchaeota archaeon]